MIAFGGTAMILIAYLGAGWLGYQLGIERGIKLCQTKRKRFN